MIKQNKTTATTSNSDSKLVLLRDTGKVLKVKTGLKGGINKASPKLF